MIDLANLFHKFYNACRVKGEEDSLCQGQADPMRGGKNSDPQRADDV